MESRRIEAVVRARQVDITVVLRKGKLPGVAAVRKWLRQVHVALASTLHLVRRSLHPVSLNSFFFISLRRLRRLSAVQYFHNKSGIMYWPGW